MHQLSTRARRYLSLAFNQRIWRFLAFSKMLLLKRNVEEAGDNSDYYIFCSGIPVTNIHEAALFVISALEGLPEDLNHVGKMISEQVIFTPGDCCQIEEKQNYNTRTVRSLANLSRKVLCLRRLTQQLIGHRDWIILERSKCSQNQNQAESLANLLSTFDSLSFGHLRHAMRFLLSSMLRFYDTAVNRGDDLSELYLGDV